MAASLAGSIAVDARRRAWLRVLAAAALPVLAVVAFGWARRWTADDGFINFRVVDQLLAGNGPVFNEGERVEIATSPLWIAVLTVFSRLFFFVRLEWVSVFLGLGLAVAAVGLGAVGSARLHRGAAAPRGLFVPLGLVAFVALSPVWDFTTSGLEVSLGLAWLAGCFAVLSRMATGPGLLPGLLPGDRADAEDPVKARAVPPRRNAAAFLLGLGPLIRPDFAVFSAAFLLALVVLLRPSWRRLVGMAAAAGALPAAYQVFRMGYYGALVPNTAFAKEAGLSNWSQGGHYIADFFGTYLLFIPLALAAVAYVLTARRRTAVVIAACAGGAAVHWLYVVRVGGDFMHARLLLPGLFTMLLPVGIVPLRRATAVAALAVLAWAAVAATSLRVDYDLGAWGPHFIVNERTVYTNAAHRDDTVTTDDYRDHDWAGFGRIVHRSAEQREGWVFLEQTSFEDGQPGVNRFPVAPGGPPAVVVFRFIGMLSYLSGPEVHVVDRIGLGDPLAARVRLVQRSRPGHEKELDAAWGVARFTAPDVSVPSDPDFDQRVQAARRAVQCGVVKRLLDAAREPMSVGRFLANIKVSLTTYGARIAGDPRLDAEQFCGGGAAAP